MTPKQLEDTFGREVAEKIVKGEGKKVVGGPELELSGLDLQTGGEGMKGYYDKIVPTQLSKLLKKLDPEAKIEMGRLPVSDRNKSAPDIARELGMTIDQINALPDAEKRALIGSVRNTISAPSITITPKMRESIKRGLPTYAEGGAVDDDDEGLTAYHGSPHDFEQFDINKIGTGEGAQAYGHGLYFAENEPVAKQYRDNLLGRWAITSGSVDNLPDRWQMAIYETMKKPAGEIRDNAINELKSKIPSEYADQINSILSNKGHMYEVRIKAKPEHFLDWDKPILDQPEVHSRIVQAVNNKASSSSKNKDAWMALAQEVGERGDETFGQHLHDALTRPSGVGLSAKEASDFLSNAGVSGIKYLDAGSRDKADKRTQNYVVFNHDLVKVKRKYARGGSVAQS
jgi:hypothetical protein